MPYEIFVRKVIRSRDPAIYVNKLGRIRLNHSVTNELTLKAIELVLLMWDKNTSTVAIRPITKKDPRAYRVSYAKKGYASGFSAKTFLDWIGYKYSTQTRSMPAEWSEEGWLTIQIPQEALQKKP